MDPKWTCEACGRVQRIFGESVRSMTTAKNQLKAKCNNCGCPCKPYYTAGVRL